MALLQSKSNDCQARTPHNRYEDMHRALSKSINNYPLIFAVLVAVEFTGLPKPREALDGSHLTTCEKLFLYFNGFSFFSSACGLMLFASSSFAPSLPPDLNPAAGQISRQLKLCAKTLPKLMYLNLFLTLSLTCAVGAYACAGLATVDAKLSEQLPLVLTCTLGGFVYIQAVWVSAGEVIEFWRDCFEEDQKLWEAMKAQTVFGKVFTSYLEHFYLPGTVSHLRNST